MYQCKKCNQKGPTPEHEGCLDKAQFVGTVPPDQARHELEKMADSVKKGGTYKIATMQGHMDPAVVAVLLASILRAGGMKTRFRMVSDGSQKTYHHVFVEMLMPGTGAMTPEAWLSIDPFQCRNPWIKSYVHPVD